MNGIGIELETKQTKFHHRIYHHVVNFFFDIFNNEKMYFFILFSLLMKRRLFLNKKTQRYKLRTHKIDYAYINIRDLATRLDRFFVFRLVFFSLSISPNFCSSWFQWSFFFFRLLSVHITNIHTHTHMEKAAIVKKI